MINVEQARAGLVAAIAQKGEDYTYPRGIDCQYSVGGVPSCIVGYAVDSIDHDLFLLLQEEEAYKSVMEVVNIDVLQFTPLASAGLQAAQNVQDGGGSWGLALEAFEEVIGNNADNGGLEN